MVLVDVFVFGRIFLSLVDFSRAEELGLSLLSFIQNLAGSTNQQPSNEKGESGGECEDLIHESDDGHTHPWLAS